MKPILITSLVFLSLFFNSCQNEDDLTTAENEIALEENNDEKSNSNEF